MNRKKVDRCPQPEEHALRIIHPVDAVVDRAKSINAGNAARLRHEEKLPPVTAVYVMCGGCVLA